VYIDIGHRNTKEEKEDNKRGTFKFLLSQHTFGSSNQREWPAKYMVHNRQKKKVGKKFSLELQRTRQLGR